VRLDDDRGSVLELPAPARRIVSLMPSLTETVCALDACDRLVGIARHANWPVAVQRLPQVGGIDDANIERIVALKPDLVLLRPRSRAAEPLERLGIRDRTAVFFTSDNGGQAAITDMRPLRAGKGSAYEGGVRVPLIVSWPGVTTPGSTSDVPVITPDIPATILDLTGAGIEPGQPIDGQSLAPLLRGGTLARKAIYWHYPHYHPGGATPHSAIRAGNWRLVHFYEDGRDELYDLAADPGETTDLAVPQPAKAAGLRTTLDRWLTDVDGQMPTPNPDADPAHDRPRGE
jgi:hypothetical protein